jgi:nucleotide-binding universal stress UspA family protein
MTGYLGRATTPSLSVQPDSAARQSREIIQAALDAVGDQHASAQIEAGDPARVLESVAQRENGRMIVVASRGIGAAHAAVFGSVTLSLLASAAVPLVIVSEAAERARALRRSTAEAAFLR